jgi:Protein of unknown function (DUF2917)
MEILLQRGEILVFQGERRGCTVQCGDGRLWVTQEGDFRDHLLQRGKLFESALPGRIVVTALSDSRLTVAEASLATGRNTLPFGWGIAH